MNNTNSYKTANKTEASMLRQQALALMKDNSSNLSLENSVSETLKLIHELQVRHIELELQNEELILARMASKNASDKYIELYDFAPSGYFTLSREGKINELNQNGANMLGKERDILKKSQFGFFTSKDTRPIFNQILENVFKSNVVESCELMFSINGDIPIYVYLTGIASKKSEQCLVIAIDTSNYKKAEQALFISNKEKVFQHVEKEKRAAELIIANKELAYQNNEKENMQ